MVLAFNRMRLCLCLHQLLCICMMGSAISVTRNVERLEEMTAQIVGGTDAVPDLYTHQVALFQGRFDYFVTCGGILIANDIILTAAHCMNYVNFAKIGLYNLYDSILFSGVEQIKICEKIRQPNNDDICLLKLCKESSLAKQGVVHAIKLNSDANLPVVGQELTVTGWGNTREGGFESMTLQEVNVNYIAQDICDSTYYYAAPGNLMCAGILNQGGKDSCQGDSGGPLIIGGQNASEFSLVGLVSGGEGCARGNFPGAYVRVSSEANWIEKQGCSMSSVTPCGIRLSNGQKQ